MNTSKSLKKFEQLLADYETALNNYSEADFAKKPSDDEWSIGQMYQHLLSSLDFFHAKHVETCLENNGENANKSKTMPGFISYLIGGFPPIQIKVPPSPQYTPPQPESIAKIRTLFVPTFDKMRSLNERLLNEKSTGKTQHPAMGFLNAEEWYVMIEMHFRHHLRQKARLDKFLGKS